MNQTHRKCIYNTQKNEDNVDGLESFGIWYLEPIDDTEISLQAWF